MLRLKEVTFAYGDNYSAVTTPGGEVGQEADLALVNELRAKAAANPSDLYLFVLDSLPMCFSGVPGAHLGRSPAFNAPNEYYGVFCDGVDGNTIAHEFGHHFCLAHPFSFEDPTAAGAAPNHDGDGIADTPEDPGEIEGVDTNATTAKQNDADAVFDVNESCRADPESCANKINDYRDWCGFTQFPTAPGSFMGNFCTSDCRRKTPDGVNSTAYSPLMNLTMSYYFRECGGPFVYNFTTYEGFTPGEISEMRDCHVRTSPSCRRCTRCWPTSASCGQNLTGRCTTSNTRSQ